MQGVHSLLCSPRSQTSRLPDSQARTKLSSLSCCCPNWKSKEVKCRWLYLARHSLGSVCPYLLACGVCCSSLSCRHVLPPIGGKVNQAITAVSSRDQQIPSLPLSPPRIPREKMKQHQQRQSRAWIPSHLFNPLYTGEYKDCEHC